MQKEWRRITLKDNIKKREVSIRYLSETRSVNIDLIDYTETVNAMPQIRTFDLNPGVRVICIPVAEWFGETEENTSSVRKMFCGVGAVSLTFKIQYTNAKTGDKSEMFGITQSCDNNDASRRVALLYKVNCGCNKPIFVCIPCDEELRGSAEARLQTLRMKLANANRDVNTLTEKLLALEKWLEKASIFDRLRFLISGYDKNTFNK